MKYRIKRGDTLSQIAQKFDTTVSQLVKDNKIDNPDLIFAGSRLIVNKPEDKLEKMQEDLVKIKENNKAVQTQKQEFVGPQFVLEEGKAQERKAIKAGDKAPPPRERDKTVPLNVRQFFHDLFGGREDITVDDLSSKEREALIQVVKNAKARGSDAISYDDYQTGQNQYADVGGGKMNLFDMYGKLQDPSYSMKTTIGQAVIKTDDNGNVIIEDQYNFNDKQGQFIFTDFLKGVKNAGLNPYSQARNVAKYFGSGEGEGSKVTINLGKIL